MALSIPKLLLSLIALFLMLANKVHSQNKTRIIFDPFDPNPTDLIYQGDAHVPFDSTSLRLTKTSSWCKPGTSSIGRVLYSRPVQLWERSTGREAAFGTTVKFTITPSSDGGGDGLAFFIAPVGTTIPCSSSGGNLGIYNYSSDTTSQLFAVEVDTYVNPGWDPDYLHLGININSRESSYMTKFDGGNGNEVLISLDYNPNTKTIRILPYSYGQDSYIHSYVFDVKTILPEQVQFGISSATGMDAAAIGITEVHSWSISYELQDIDVSENIDSTAAQE